ncbi:hypothetical protein KFK09_023997 [Dendrobium nobile]|uniref:Zinc knuckle CX2CX4HX4C domain-containing protein n=1 Tax=Dendrobium nobile TaxID=94219 RepID=A0A8T3ACT2_DENNO|nr:hypothetical protein KFK09_023997 [Dendrobium nobile]
MEKWSLDFSTLSLKGLTSPIWIRMPHLPLQCWDEVNVACIASSVGKPLMMDGNMFQWGRREFARVCVRVRLDQCLPLGVWVESISVKFFQKFEYEKVSTLCYGCGMVEHLKNDCKLKTAGNSGMEMNGGGTMEAKEVEKVKEDVADSSYGPWIMVKKKFNRRPVIHKDNPREVKK